MDRAVPLALPSGVELITRRRMLEGAGIVLAALTVRQGPSSGQAAIAGKPSAGLRRSDYRDFVGQSFRFTGPSARMSIPLAAIEDVAAPRSLAGSERAFILVFHAPHGSAGLGQSVMTVRHPRGFSQRLLVTPAGTGRRGQDYAVVINRANLA